MFDQIKKAFRETFHTHLINDNRLPNSRKGSVWKRGRFFVSSRKTLALTNRDPEAHVGWTFLDAARLFCFHIRLDSPGGEDDISVSGGIPYLFYLHASVQGLVPTSVKQWIGLYNPGARAGDVYIDRSVGWSIHDGTAWISLWENDNGWCITDPKWWKFHFSVNPIDLLGRKKYTSEVIEEQTVDVPMPEGTYPAKVQICADKWERPRWRGWPFSETILRAHVDMIKPIPFPGKGENSWDCGDDALHGSCGPARNVEEAIGDMVATVLRNRLRYGGSHTFEPMERCSKCEAQDDTSKAQVPDANS